MKSFFLFIFFLILHLYGQAQKTQKDSLQSLPQIIVSFNKSQATFQNIPVSAAVITPKTIQNLPVMTIDQALQSISGINVQRPFGIFGKSVVGMRGVVSSEPSRQLTLIDGIPVNKADGGTVNWNRIINLDVARVEVLKGPSAILYGNNAMGGIVNIITRKPHSERLKGVAKTSYGSYKTKAVSFSLGQRLNANRTYYQISGMYVNGDGYVSVPESLRDSTDIAGFVRKKAINVRSGYQIDAYNKVTLEYNYYDDHNGQGRKIFLPEGQTADYDTHFVKTSYQYKKNQTIWELRLFYQYEKYLKNIEKLKRVNYTLIDVVSNRKDYGVQTNWQWKSAKHQINLGSGLRLGQVAATDRYQTATDQIINKGKQYNYSFYAQDNWNLLPQKLDAVLAAAYHISQFKNGLFEINNSTHNTNFMLDDTGKLPDQDWQGLTYNFALQYHFSRQTNLYISTSKAFRTPNLDDMTRTGFINIGYKLANPDLKPETIYNQELGFRIDDQNWHGQLTLFYANGKNFMYYVATGATLFGGRKQVYQKENVSNVRIYGLESSLNHRFSDFFRGQVAYTLNQTEITDFAAQENLTGKHLAYVPNHIVQTSLFFDRKKWQGAVSYTYKSIQYRDAFNNTSIPEQQLLDVKISYKIWHNLQLGTQVQNLLNKQYLVSSDQLSLGRYVTFWAKISF